MNTPPRRLFRPLAGCRSVVLPGLLLVLALFLGACGDDEDTSTGTASGGTTAVAPNPPGDGDAVTSTDVEPGSGSGIPDLPENDDPSAIQCTGPPQEVFDATAVVGEPLDEATKAARAAGCDVRVVIEDGEPLAVTDDFRPDRVNVVVTDGAVERIEGLY